MSPSADALVVRTSLEKGLLMLLGCLVFVLIGVGMVTGADGPVTIAFGVAVVLFFGACGVVIAVSALRGRALFTADAAGLHPAVGGVLPWADVEVMAPYRVAGSTWMLGVRMRDTERLVASMTDADRARMLRRARRWRTAGASPVADIAGYFDRQRRHSGWDMAWPQTAMDHDIEDVLRRCERWHDAAAG